MLHSQVPIKVNALVDEEIVPLVEALNECEYIATVDSCQSGNGCPAYMYFKYTGCPENEPDFFFQFVKTLSSHIVGCDDHRFRVEWYYDFLAPMAQLLTSRNNVRSLAVAVSSAVKSLRMSQSSYDM